MNKLLLSAFCILASGSVAAETWDINGQNLEVTVHRTADSYPGCTIHTVVVGTGSAQRKIWYWEVDLTAKNTVVRTYNPENIRTTGTKVPDMAAKLTDRGLDVRFGANADLYSTYGPIGTTVMDGEIVKVAKTSTAWHAVGFDDERKEMRIGTVTVNFAAKLNGVTEYSPTLVNVPMANNETIIYSRRWGTTTGTTPGAEGLEILLKPEDGFLRSDGPTVCKVVGAPVRNGGNMAIPEGHIVLSTNIASHINDLGLMKDGDEYTITASSINMSITPMNGYSFARCTQLIGGDPVLLANGEKLSSYATMPNYDTRRDRTAIGTDETHTRMYVLVVEKSGESAGANARELASIMKSIGCYDALNFDGGGSTTMWTSGAGVLNYCSDGAPRAVRNGIFVIYDPENGVGEITLPGIDETAPTEYYDMHGIRIDNPVPGGLYIRRRGSVSDKLIVR